MNDIKTFNANFGDDHKVYESNKKSKHLDYFLEVKPSLFEGEGDVRTVVCLVCAIEKKTINSLKYSSTGCLTSHLNYHHKCNSSNKPLRTLLKDKVKEKFVNRPKMCEKCHSFGMIIYEAKDSSNEIRCDYRGCERDGASFERDEQFVGCSRCGE